MKEQLLGLYERLGDTHTLLLALQARDAVKFPLPGNSDELLGECEEALNAVRDDLLALARTEETN